MMMIVSVYVCLPPSESIFYAQSSPLSLSIQTNVRLICVCPDS